MIKLIPKLSTDLGIKLKTADEIWIAVALLNAQGQKFITKDLKDGCKQNYLVGLDLPTEPKALYELNKLQYTEKVIAKVYVENKCFHPKLYLLREGNTYSAFIGSANCTNGGLLNNIELSIFTEDPKVCKDILKWFNEIFNVSLILTEQYIDNYAIGYEISRQKKKDEERNNKKKKAAFIKDYNATIKDKSKFLKMLRDYRKAPQYKQDKNDRQRIVRDLRATIDYPTCINIDVDAFFSIQELGHIVAIPKPTIKREINKFRKLLKMLFDENIDISQRVNRALEGDLEIRGVGIALISKLLVIHRPDLYYVRNEKTSTTLRRYRIEVPRNITEGTKYKILSEFLKQVCGQTKIDDLAILDYYLYLEGN